MGSIEVKSIISITKKLALYFFVLLLIYTLWFVQNESNVISYAILSLGFTETKALIIDGRNEELDIETEYGTGSDQDKYIVIKYKIEDKETISKIYTEKIGDEPNFSEYFDDEGKIIGRPKILIKYSKICNNIALPSDFVPNYRPLWGFLITIFLLFLPYSKNNY